MRRLPTRLLALSTEALAILALVACASEPPPPPAPVQQQGPDAEILAIGSVWESRSQENGLRSEPSPVSVFTVNELSSIAFTAGEPSATESLVVSESFRMRDGRTFECHSEGTVGVQVRYFRKSGEPAVQITWPPVQLPRNCAQPGFPEPVMQRGGGSSSFLLRAERLSGFDPPLEKRSYIPVQ